MKLLRVFLLLVFAGSVFKGFFGIFTSFSGDLVFLWNPVSEAEFRIQNYKNRFRSIKNA